MQQDHRLGGCLGLELEVDVAALAHVEGRQLDDSILLPEGDRVVKQDVAVALEWPERKSSFFPVKGSSGVTEVQRPDWQEVLLDDLSAVVKPVVMAGVTIAPLVRIKADTE